MNTLFNDIMDYWYSGLLTRFANVLRNMRKILRAIHHHISNPWTICTKMINCHQSCMAVISHFSTIRTGNSWQKLNVKHILRSLRKNLHTKKVSTFMKNECSFCPMFISKSNSEYWFKHLTLVKYFFVSVLTLKEVQKLSHLPTLINN